MSAQHTPGPWFAYNADYQGRPDEAPIFTVGPEEFHTVAQVRAGNTDDDLPAQTRANASLIAAAPDLLTSLRLLLPMAEGDVCEYGGDPDKHLGIIAARAAIAKATAP